MAPVLLKLLIDTNVIIPLDPTRPADLHDNTSRATELQNLASEIHAQLWIHPAAMLDLARDTDENRRSMRQQLLRKYLTLENPPGDRQIETIVGAAANENDWVDNQLLAALIGDAVDYLVTEDLRISRKARALGIEQRVFTIAAAIAHLRGLFDRAPQPPPAVRSAKAYELDLADPILDSFRADYDGFNGWLQKCRREHRQTWIIDADGRHAAFAIVNEEQDATQTEGEKTLKICSFKVAPEHRGFRFGELLLKAIFRYAEANRYATIFVTSFPKQEDLIALFEDFGFIPDEKRLANGEVKFRKSLRPEQRDSESLDPLTFNVRFGPAAVSLRGASVYLVPIQPRYCDYLFPETTIALPLFTGYFAFGNGLRKAYLCNSSTRTIKRGDVIVFYRSEIAQGIVATGIIEQTLVSRSAEDIARTVGKRTVYRFTEIQELCAKRDVLT
ncbi:MAG TPA: GNAT family N-acetyltransferase, partial [Thermoanaerobaculia bacterium]